MDDKEKVAIDAAVRNFSITALGYDPEKDDEPPRIALDWVRLRMKQNAIRQQHAGAVLIAIITAGIGTIAWSQILPWVKSLLH